MAVIPAPVAPTHHLGGASFTSLATPSRGSTDTCVWQVEIRPGVPATPHRLTREEVFVILSGSAHVRIDGESATAEPLRALCCLPVGGQARLADGEPFTPPWAQ